MYQREKAFLIKTAYLAAVLAVGWLILRYALVWLLPFLLALGFAALPAAYFAYLIPCILLYMVLATSLKKAYVRHYGELL